MRPKITVFRLGHRLPRDSRLTTHVFLVARALGADSGIYSGQRDPSLESSIARATEEWGGDFRLEYVPHWKQSLTDYIERGWETIHLTMYGLPHTERMGELSELSARKLVIVGGEKVPSELFKLADYNLSVTRQPHSEVAALAIFLYDLSGRKLREDFSGKIRILPSERRKMIVRSRR